jgi:hypothetical protein
MNDGDTQLSYLQKQHQRLQYFAFQANQSPFTVAAM